MFLTEQEKQTISDAIRAAESRTSGEIVTVIARAVDDYLYIPTLWAGLLALFTPSVLLLMPIELEALIMYTIQICIFVTATMLFRWTPLKLALIPKAVKYRRASRLAYEQFIQQGLHRTAERNGLLLFVAVAERYVEIIADQGINERVPKDTWSGIVDQFVILVKQRKIAAGFLTAIERCGNILQEHFPVEPLDQNELPNHLVEL
ncbi:MAG: TPM domain-containing protein [Gammaproteobacteria bacterium]|nr:TPM domain-containing protein [Gammaproteobacteria bacterium]